MRGHIIAEKQFLHQGIEHHVFVTALENAENEYRFEVQRTPLGDDHPETIYERIVDFSYELSQNSDTTNDELMDITIAIIKNEVFVEEDIHAHDP